MQNWKERMEMREDSSLEKRARESTLAEGVMGEEMCVARRRTMKFELYILDSVLTEPFPLASVCNLV